MAAEQLPSKKRASLRLTQAELRAILCAAGEGGEGYACFEDENSNPDPERVAAYESAMASCAGS